MYRQVDGGAVLLSVNEEVYYGLNAVGSYIWEHLPPVLQTFDELVATLAATYPDVPAETIRTDIAELLHDLVASGLVLPPGGTDGKANENRPIAEARQATFQRLG